MADLSKGTTFTPGGQVTDTNLNALVDAATITNIATADINDNAITTSKLAAGAVETANLDSDAVTTVKVADDAITEDKLDNKALLLDELSPEPSGSPATTAILPEGRCPGRVV